MHYIGKTYLYMILIFFGLPLSLVAIRANDSPVGPILVLCFFGVFGMIFLSIIAAISTPVTERTAVLMTRSPLLTTRSVVRFPGSAGVIVPEGRTPVSGRRQVCARTRVAAVSYFFGRMPNE